MRKVFEGTVSDSWSMRCLTRSLEDSKELIRYASISFGGGLQQSDQLLVQLANAASALVSAT